MKRIFILMFGIFLMTPSIYSQTVQSWTEDFDGNVSFTAIPSGSWISDAMYHLPGSSTTNPQSILGLVPPNPGDTTILQTIVYDCSPYSHVFLRFSHICKVSPYDIVQIEYRIDGGGGMDDWEVIPGVCYMGKASNFATSGFNAASYPEWQADDSTVLPSQSWWKEELFDLEVEARYVQVQFRFMIIHRQQMGTQASYGWLIDNFELFAANNDLKRPKVEFKGNRPMDTVYTVGPFVINALVKTSTNAPVLHPWIVYTSTLNGVSATDSVEMEHIAGDSLWSGIIPQFLRGTSVSYSITGRDTFDNSTTATAWYTIQKPPVTGIHGEVIIGTGTSTSVYSPYYSSYDRTWTRAIYYGREFNPQMSGAYIKSIAYDNSTTAHSTVDKLSVYVKATKDSIISGAIYIDPATDGATLVWGEATHTTTQGWNTFTFHTPFYLPPGYHLMVYWINNDGDYRDNGTEPAWYYTSQSVNNHVWAYQDGNPDMATLTNISLNTLRPNIKAYLAATDFSNHSAALVEINSPLLGQTTGGVSAPIAVTLENKGDSALTSATIKWSVNGGQIDTLLWTGNLLWGYQQQLSLGDYIPSIGAYDTVVIWISMPNGVLDGFLDDDTLAIITYGCSPDGMTGVYRIGQTGDFKTLQEAIDVLKLCASSGGDVIFELETGTYAQSIDLSGLSLGGGSFTITSVTHNANDVIISPPSGSGIILSKNNNITIKDITVDMALSTMNAIEFTGACTNIVIRDCRILASIGACYGDDNPVYAYAGGLDSIFIINNFMDGGYYGIYIYGAGRISTNIIIDSNTIQNNCTYGIVMTSNVYCISISYNTVVSLSSLSYPYDWYGIYLYQAHVTNMIGNRIRSTDKYNPKGIYFLGQQSVASMSDTALIANNEIIFDTITNAGHAMYVGDGRMKIINNSMYQGNENSPYESYGLYIEDYTSNWMTIKNNNIVMEGEYDYPVLSWGYLSAPNYDIDYNNMYAPTYIAYTGSWGVISDISEWQQDVPTDLHSVSFYPDFIDVFTNLELSDYTDLECEKHPAVYMDINNLFRIGALTTMGCYHGIAPLSINATLQELSRNREGPIQGESDNIKVILVNTGATTLTKATIKWEWNGISQPDTTWTGSLLTGMSAVIPLGMITYVSEGDYTLKVWIDNLDTLIDEYPDDDTLFASGYICSASLSGTLTVGTNNADFATLKEFTDRLPVCKANGNIILELQPEIHNGILNLSELENVLGGNTLTVTSSATGNAMNTIIKPAVDDAGIILNRSNNVTIKGITVDASAGTSPAIQFTGACTNVLIRDCRLLANPNTTSAASAPVYKADVTGIVDNVSFINDTLDGGYYGFFFYGGTGSSSMGTNVVFDSNTVSNQYYYATYPMYVDFTSCSYNTILSRTSGSINSTWYALRMCYSNGAAVGNRIIQRSNSITSPYGIYSYYHNYYSTTNKGLIANNEIILDAANSYYGIHADISKSEILHNSIYISGSGAARGIYISSSTNNDLVIKNNNIVLTSAFAHPVYFSSTGNLSLYDIDYNNYYAPTYIGYYGNNITDMSAWQTQITTDLHSINVLPIFNDASNNLQVTNYRELLCNKIPSVDYDVNRDLRTSLTAMGCYNGLPDKNVNAMLAEIIGLKEGSVALQTDTVKITVYNTGSTPLTSVNLEWSINGVSQNAGGTDYPISLLAKEQSTTIVLGTITYPAGLLEVKVWINNLNGGANVDEYLYDDTVSQSVLICSGALNGLITVGQSAGSDFKTFKQVYDALYSCGVDGDLTVAFEPDVYTENLDFSNNTSLLSGYTLTITSTTNKASDVIFRSSSGVGVLFKDSRNIVLKDITVDANVSQSYAIQFTAACTNILIRDCRLLADTITTSSASAPVYKGTTTGTVDSIFFINNLLDGGYYGFYFYGGTGSTEFGTNVVFDSNTVSNQYNYGTYPYYVDFTSCSYNTILSRSGTIGVGSTWYGLRMYYANGPVTGNRIIQRSNSITTPYGMYLYYHNYYPTAAIHNRTPVVNNEIILNTTGAYSGVYAYYTKSDILHNSIYISGTGAARGIYIDNSTSNDMIIKNNNIVLPDSSSAYPMYFSATGNLTLYDIDYNNYYASTYIGYYGNAQTTLTDWKGQIATDQHSVKVLPQFVNPANSLELSTSNDTLQCPVITGIISDIQGNGRYIKTAMGAYTQPPVGLDLMLLQVSPWDSEVLNNQIVSINVDLLNTGIVPITSAIFGWSLNGAEQLPSITWTPTTPLNSRQTQNIFIETFQASNADTFDVVVWIKTINGQPDSVNLNDTVSATAVKVPLVEFAAPFVDDTIAALSFDVNIKIREGSGAPVYTPEMYVYVEACNSNTIDTITVPIIQDGDTWVANIPKQYYNRTVIYETHISDSIGNNVTLRDSTYIMFDVAKLRDSIGIYTGIEQTIMLSAGTYMLECWGADGGSANGQTGGKGGYSSGTLTLPSRTTLYINVGGAGTNGSPIYTLQNPGGFNGGGNGGSAGADGSGSGGGGGTHIATSTGVLSSLANNKTSVLIVAGGGGGSGYYTTTSGGNGGGVMGANAIGNGYPGLGATQTDGGDITTGAAYPGTVGIFGKGGDGYTGTGGGNGGGGGGGGYYGGGAGATGYNTSSCGGGGAGSGYIAGVAAGVTAQFGELAFVSNPDITGNGHVRITSISGDSGNLYSGTDLAIFNLVSPENNDDELCVNVSSPVEIDLLNLGGNDYDFTKDSITLGYEIINSRGIIYNGEISIDTGALLSGESMTIELMSALPIVSGSYTIKAWVTSAIDNFICDDTLKTVYISNLKALPVDEDFSSNILSSDFITIPVIGQDVWTYDTGSLVLPPSGENGKLIYTGTYGSMTQLITRQLDLSGVIDPKLEFWYYHDPSLPITDRSYTNVNIIVDGVVNTVQTLFKKDTVQGWKQYTVDLKNYTNAQCVLIQFESMNKAGSQSAQYLGHITITSTSDLAVSEIIISPELAACEVDGKDLKVVLTTTLNQAVDFMNTGNNLIVEAGVQSFTYSLSERIGGMSSDTVTVATNVDLKGITDLSAYLETPVDGYSANDTAYFVADIQPALSVTINPVTTVNSRIKIGSEVWQEVVIENTGNVELSGIELLLRITGTNQDIIRETLPVDLAVGATHTYTFVNSYIVPGDERYQVSLIAYLGCDSSEVNTGNAIDEYVDMHNLSIISIDNLPMGEPDTVGATIYITITLANTDDVNSFEDVSIFAAIENEEGQALVSYLGTIEEILPLETKPFTVEEPYTVPEDSVYRIRVYIDNVDDYPENDTVEMIRRTEKEDVSVKGLENANLFTLAQNIPNPANNSTYINYSIPEAGAVVFNLHSVSGQLLYSKTIEATSGKQSMELNTSIFAAGIYFYSIEYKGQRLVKRMIVQ